MCCMCVCVTVCVCECAACMFCRLYMAYVNRLPSLYFIKPGTCLCKYILQHIYNTFVIPHSQYITYRECEIKCIPRTLNYYCWLSSLLYRPRSPCSYSAPLAFFLPLVQDISSFFFFCCRLNYIWYLLMGVCVCVWFVCEIGEPKRLGLALRVCECGIIRILSAYISKISMHIFFSGRKSKMYLLKTC